MEFKIFERKGLHIIGYSVLFKISKGSLHKKGDRLYNT